MVTEVRNYTVKTNLYEKFNIVKIKLIDVRNY